MRFAESAGWPMSFHESLHAGQSGEDLVSQRFAARPDVRKVLDVSKDPDFQRIGVDLVVSYRDSSVRWVEVKTDSHQPRNVFVETIANESKRSAGCFIYSKAHTWIVLYHRHGKALWLPLAAAKEHILPRLEEYRAASSSTRIGGREAYRTLGRLVPIRDILRNVPGSALIDIEGPSDA